VYDLIIKLEIWDRAQREAARRRKLTHCITYQLTVRSLYIFSYSAFELQVCA